VATPPTIDPAHPFDAAPSLPNIGDAVSNLHAPTFFTDLASWVYDSALSWVSDNWGVILVGLLLAFCLILVPAILRRFEWGPHAGPDNSGSTRYGSDQGSWNV
jgi:hypothetical protein